MKQQPVTVVARIKAKVGQENFVKRSIVDLVGTARSEKGCLMFEVQQEVNDSSLFMSYERWENQSDLNAHLAQPYMRDFFASAVDLLDSQPEITQWKVLSPSKSRPKGQEESQMDSENKTLVAAIDALSKEVKVPLEKIAAALGGAGVQLPGHSGTASTSHSFLSDAPSAAVCDSREHAFMRYTVGTGKFSKGDNMRFSSLACAMFKMNGDPDGHHEGVWEPQGSPNDLTIVPHPPDGSLREPEGPVPKFWPSAFTKAIWTFGDNSSITAIGPAMLHLVPLTDESQIFVVSVAGIITNGEGRFKGARGVKTALGATFVPAGKTMFDPSIASFQALTIETFRVVLARDVAP